MNGFVPSWIQPANEVGNLAHGYQIGMSIGARQAEQAFREQQAMRQQQLDAQEKARWEAEFGLRAKQASDRATAIRAYQSDIASGMDPVQAIIKHGPSIGQQGTVEAAALRAAQQRMGAPGLTGGLMDIGGGFKAFQTGPNTRTLVRPSETVTGQLMQAITPDGQPIAGTFITPKGQAVHMPKPADTGKVQRELVKMRLSRLNKMLGDETAIDQAKVGLMASNPKMSMAEADTQVRQGLEKQIKDLEQQYLSAGEKPSQKNEVRRTTKDGRVAIFDANTKEFLRFAD